MPSTTRAVPVAAPGASKYANAVERIEQEVITRGAPPAGSSDSAERACAVPLRDGGARVGRIAEREIVR